MGLIIDHARRFDNSSRIMLFMFFAFCVGIWTGDLLCNAAYRDRAEQEVQRHVADYKLRSMGLEYRADQDMESPAQAIRAARLFVRRMPR